MKGAIVLASGLFAALLAALVFGIACSSWQPERHQVWQQDGAMLFSKTRALSDFDFVDQYGKRRDQASFDGRWKLVFFGYTFCPDICPTTLLELSRTWKKLPQPVKEQWQVVFVSIDPERDTPEAMAPYMAYFNKDFLALTGNPQSLQSLSGELNAFFAKVERGEGKAYLMDHSANMAVVSPDWQYSGYIEPPHRPDRMVELLGDLLN